MLQHTLEIFVKGETTPLMTLNGDLRDTTFPKKLLTSLEGWEVPPIYSRITVADPNGGNYADEFATPKGKIVTLNWSIFHRNDTASYEALEELKQLDGRFFTLKVTTLLDDGATVTESLEDCYIFNEPTVVKAVNEYKVSTAMESKNFDFSSTVLTPPVPVEPEGPDLTEFTGGPFNGLYTHNDNDPRNFESPRYNIDRDPNNPDNISSYDLQYSYASQPIERIGGPFNGPYTLEVDDQRNFNAENYYADSDPNNPNGWSYDPKYIITAPWPELFGGPFNNYYTLYPYDPRNWNSPSYYPPFDPNDPSSSRYDDTGYWRDVKFRH